MRFVNSKNLSEYVRIECQQKSWGGTDDYNFSFVSEKKVETDDETETTKLLSGVNGSIINNNNNNNHNNNNNNNAKKVSFFGMYYRMKILIIKIICMFDGRIINILKCGTLIIWSIVHKFIFCSYVNKPKNMSSIHYTFLLCLLEFIRWNMKLN